MPLVERYRPRQRARRVERYAIATGIAQRALGGAEKTFGKAATLRRSPHRHAAQVSFAMCAGFITNGPDNHPCVLGDQDGHVLHSLARGIGRKHSVRESAARVLRAIRLKRVGEALTDRESIAISRTSDRHQMGILIGGSC